MCCVVSVLISVTQDSFYTRISSGLSRGAKESFPCLTYHQILILHFTMHHHHAVSPSTTILHGAVHSSMHSYYALPLCTAASAQPLRFTSHQYFAPPPLPRLALHLLLPFPYPRTRPLIEPPSHPATQQSQPRPPSSSPHHLPTIYIRFPLGFAFVMVRKRMSKRMHALEHV